MRQEEDDKVVEIRKKERRCADAARFGRVEVREMRAIFKEQFNTDSSVDGLSFQDCLSALSKIVGRVREKAECDLRAHFQASDDNQDQMLDFPEFLLLIRRLQDTNWMDTLGKSSKLLRRSI